MRMLLYEEVRAEQTAQAGGWVFTFEDRQILEATRRWMEEHDVTPISPEQAYGPGEGEVWHLRAMPWGFERECDFGVPAVSPVRAIGLLLERRRCP
jgi:hypothetical protein